MSEIRIENNSNTADLCMLWSFTKLKKITYIKDEDLKSKITLSNNYTWAHIYVCKQTAETCVLLKKKHVFVRRNGDIFRLLHSFV